MPLWAGGAVPSVAGRCGRDSLVTRQQQAGRYQLAGGGRTGTRQRRGSLYVQLGAFARKLI